MVVGRRPAAGQVKLARLRAVLEFARRGAAPATVDQRLSAREAVVSVKPALCRTGAVCKRSIATALLCRVRGTWPTWCTGVRTIPSPPTPGSRPRGSSSARAIPRAHFKTLMSIPPVSRDQDR
ncbi:lasso peptide biosynthesis B2 protein [Streptomyces tricolor]|nr:lasso peptide biosynthesis B2 protein [Streptomyces tricolor]